jgi:hypothetical protein
LDYWAKVDKSPNKTFSRLDFAIRDLPVSIHSRSWGRILSDGHEERPSGIPLFNRSETLRRVIDSGYLVSATPALNIAKRIDSHTRDANRSPQSSKPIARSSHHGKAGRTLLGYSHFVAELKRWSWTMIVGAT